jgi:uncharacterized protein YggE
LLPGNQDQERDCGCRPGVRDDIINNKSKHMKKLFLLFSIQLIAIISFGQSIDNGTKDPFISVTGTAKMEIIPDKIFLDIILTEKDRNDKRDLNEIEVLFLGVLDKLNISKEDLSLSDANSSLIRIPWRGKKITKSKEYQVMVKDVKTLTTLLNELESVDISNVRISSVDHSKIEEFRKEVKTKAIIAAKEKAEYLLKAIGKELGDPVEISENLYNITGLQSNVPGANISMRGARSSATEYSVEDQITFEKIELEFSIFAKFKIK